MRYLGIDYGTKRIGLALSDKEGTLAFAHSVVKTAVSSPQEIAALAKREHAEAVVLGESKNYKGEPNAVMKPLLKFKAEFEAASGLPVFFEEEFLTSAEAERITGKHDKLDAQAAAIILQSFLDKQR